MLRSAAISTAYCIFFVYFVLVASLFFFVGPKDIGGILFSERVLFSIKISLQAAAAATALSMIVAVPAAYALSRLDFAGKGFVDSVLEVPLIVSPIALGAMLLIFFNTGAGEIVQRNGIAFVFEFPGIVLAQFVTSAGIATRMMKAVFDGISPRYEAVAGSLGASPFMAFATVTLPIARKGIVASAIITFAKCIGEFGATITLAGSMPFKTETLPMSVFLKLSNSDIGGTVVSILVLLAIGTTVLFVSKILAEVRKYD